MSNTERQRKFRERNPGYYGRLHRRRKQESKVFQAATRTALASALSESEAMSVASWVAFKQVNLLLAIAQAKRPLMLPAPSQEIRIPGVNAIPTRAELEAMRTAMRVETQVDIPQD